MIPRTPALVLALSACATAQLPSDLVLQPPSELRDAIELYATDRSALNRRHSISVSETRHERFDEFYRGWANRLAAIDFDALGQ